MQKLTRSEVYLSDSTQKSQPKSYTKWVKLNEKQAGNVLAIYKALPEMHS
jgi:hypothetical protein